MDIEFRKCSSCNKLLELSNEFFPKNISKPKGYDYQCKHCKRKSQVNRSTHKHKKLRIYIIKSLGSKCNDCGIKHDDPSFFDIEHIIPNSLFNKKRTYNKDLTNKQILCPNCHRIKNIKEKFKGIYTKTKHLI